MPPISNHLPNRDTMSLPPVYDLAYVVPIYIADDGHTRAAFEIAVRQERLGFRTAMFCDRPGFKKYDVLYDDPAKLVQLGFTFGSIFRS